MPTKNVAPYKRNFLNKVILKCDYDFIDLGKLEEFAKSVKAIFPFQESQEGVNREMEIDFNKGKVISNNGIKSKQWNLLSADRNKYLLITPNFVSLEYINNSYKNKTELVSDFEKTLLPFLNFFKINTVNRIGLRYLNDINLNSIKGDFDWSIFFHKDLLNGIYLNKRLKNDLSRSMSTTEMKQGEANIRFTYGIWNKDYPNENTRKEFILDIDCYSKFPHDTNETITETIKEYNKISENIFEKNIKDGLRNILRK